MSWEKQNFKYGKKVSASLQEPLFPQATSVTTEAYNNFCDVIDNTL